MDVKSSTRTNGALTAARRRASCAEGSRTGLPAARPLGQCCRYCRQHCTGLALWAARLARPRFNARDFRARRFSARHSARAEARAGDCWNGTAFTGTAPCTQERQRRGDPVSAGRAQCNAAGSIGSIGRGSPEGHWIVSERESHAAKRELSATRFSVAQSCELALDLRDFRLELRISVLP